MFLKILLGVVGFGFVVFLGIAIYVYSLWIDLPDVTELADYEYDLPTQVYDRKGILASEYYEQRRILIRSEDIPRIVRDAVLAIEDNRFYEHFGIDPIRIAKAFFVNVSTMSFREGASTLTQQTAKQFLLTPEKNLERKIKEILLSLQMERVFSKDKILELYLNKAFFGRQSYGIEAAAQNYFSKSLKQLDIAEASLLAGLLKAPSRYSPTRSIVRSKKRRNLVLTMMYRNNFITKEELICAKGAPVVLKLDKKRTIPGLSYFIEEIRRILTGDKKYGREKLITGGLKITTTMDLQVQEKAQKALEQGIERIDRRHGYRGPIKNILKKGVPDPEELEKLTENNFSERAYLTGVVVDVSEDSLKVDLGAFFGDMSLENANWAIPYDLNTLVHENNQLDSLKKEFEPGDVILVRPLNNTGMDTLTASIHQEYVCDPDTEQQTEDQLRNLRQFDETETEKFLEADKKSLDVILYQLPEANGALLSMSPQTGEVYAIAGGYSFGKSQFNRATQSFRQSGSAFKPFVYTVALKEGYKANDIIEDTPLTFQDLVSKFSWVPKNYGGKFEGEVTLRYALTKSKNVPTVKIAKDIGIRKVIDFLKTAGIDTSNLPNDLSASLGSGSLTLVDLITAYSMFADAGKIPKPIYIQKIENRNGVLLFEAEHEQKQVLDSQTAFIMHTILGDVVEKGTGKIAKQIDRKSFGKTGTTDNNTDAWYIGYIPHLITGVYVGNDSPVIPLGYVETGARAAGTIWVDFMKSILTLDRPEYFSGKITKPRGVTAIKISESTGQLACGNEKDQYVEYFISGDEPTRCSSDQNLNFPGSLNLKEDENFNFRKGSAGGIEL